jgi:hypothetical protein
MYEKPVIEFEQFLTLLARFVPQRFSWDNLLISEAGLRLLLSHFKIFPALIDVVNAFGAQTSSESDSISACHSYVRANISGQSWLPPPHTIKLPGLIQTLIECCYVARHVEAHGREELDDPWSIRQMGVYHQRNVWDNTNTFVIFNPSKTFQQRLKDAQINSTRLPTWRDIHTLAASCSTTPWRRYISHIELKLAQLVNACIYYTLQEHEY